MEITQHTFDSDEFMKLSRALEAHHGIFYRLWNMGKPIFTDRIQTAAVEFDKLGDSINFLINYDFWCKLDWTEKQFTICHEALHIILNHGIRIKNLQSNPDLTNQALDVVVNHSLIEKFNFNRKEVDKENKYCWIDTVFANSDTILLDKAFEYYYNILAAQQQEQMEMKSNVFVSGGKNNILDDHSHLEDFGKIIDKLNEECSEQELESIQGMIEKHSEDNQAGTEAGSHWVFVKIGTVKKKKKWETVIKRWAIKQDKEEIEENWIRPNRRLACLSSDLILPADTEIDSNERDKIDVMIFLDTSGSCYHLRTRLFTAASSLPTERFRVQLFCFDTKVYPTTLSSKKLFGFGGTSFTCIENYIQRHMKENNKSYPAACFILTDGFGNNVFPAFPKKWHWFVSTNYINCIPKESKVYMLKDFE